MSAASMLMENPQKRPTIYEVLREACSMQGKEVPIHDVCDIVRGMLQMG